MKQRQPSMDQDSGELQLDPRDLLTGEEIKNSNPPLPNQTVPNQNQTPPPPQQDTEDLHKMEQMPDANRRQAIADQVDQRVAPKMMTIEEKIQNDILGAQQKKFEGMPKHPKDILKKLISIGEYKQDFELFGHTWTLRALDQGDSLLSLEEIKDSFQTQSGKLMSMMFGTLIYAVDAIDGISVYEWFDDIRLQDYGGNRMEYHIAVRRALRAYLEAIPPRAIDLLYEKYLEMDDNRNKGIDELKNS